MTALADLKFDHFHELIDSIAYSELKKLNNDITYACLGGEVSDEQAERLQARIQQRMSAANKARPAYADHRQRVGLKRQEKRRPPTSERVQIRRGRATRNMMPEPMRRKFTTAELSVMNVIGVEFTKRRGKCELSYDEIADMALCSRSTVKRAIKVARDLGFLAVQLRPRKGLKSETNVLRPASSEWLSWLGLAVPDRGSAPAPLIGSYIPSMVCRELRALLAAIEPEAEIPRAGR